MYACEMVAVAEDIDALSHVPCLDGAPWKWSSDFMVIQHPRHQLHGASDRPNPLVDGWILHANRFTSPQSGEASYGGVGPGSNPSGFEGPGKGCFHGAFGWEKTPMDPRTRIRVTDLRDKRSV